MSASGSGTSSRTATLQNAAAATGNGTVLALSPGDEVMLKTLGATIPSATIVFEVSYDSQSTWENAFLEDALAAGGISTLINTLAVSTSIARSRYRQVPGATHLRARVSIFVTGTVTVTAVVNSRP